VATTKRAQYQFRVKEGPERLLEPREGVLEMFSDMFIVAESGGREPVSERPLKDPDFLSFDLREGSTLDEAQLIADFLNEHLLYVDITRFGDAEDAARDVRQSEHVRQIDLERFSMVVGTLREKLAVGDVPAAVEALTGVQSVIADIISGWSDAITKSREILGAFGEGGDHDPA
jgi:hypothetical protein